MTEPKEEPALEGQTSEEAAPEEARAKEKQEFVPILDRLFAITGLISFCGPILFVFFFSRLGIMKPSVAGLLEPILILLFFAIPISAIIGLLSCILLWRASTTKANEKNFIVLVSIDHGCSLLFFIFWFSTLFLS